MLRKLRLFVFFLVLLAVFVPGLPVYAGSGSQEVLKVGSSGGRVWELQGILQKQGFFPSTQKATGYFGWITYGAVTALEKKHGLPVDGQVGDKEWEVLYGKSSRVVMGYYTVDYPGDRLSHDSYLKYNKSIDQLGMFDFTLDEKGNLKGTPSSEGIAEARSKGSKSLMVVHNISGGIDARSAYMALTNYRAKVVDNIVGQIDKNGYDGVNIDLEGIPPAYKTQYNALLEDLSKKLKARGKLLTVAIPAKTSDNGSAWNEAYDYRNIGRLADYVVIMSYDEHWFGGPPGPVASISWVASVMDYAVKTIPSNKVLMGIGCYGYDWPQGQNGKAIRWKDMPSLTRYGSVQWDNNYSVPYLIYWQSGVKHQVWFENSYSLAIKLELVNKYNLGGIAFWRLGFEDSSFWDTLNKKR
jgi:spore germination protein YaaH